MKIVFLHFYRKPNPDYANTVAAIRERGHTVWLGEVTPEGDFWWSDGNGSIEKMPGFHRDIDRHARNPLAPLFTRFIVWQFLRRVRLKLRELDPEIVQINPDSMAWFIPLGMPRSMKFIFDVKQINMGVKRSFLHRLRDRSVGLGWRLTARYFYSYACFDYYLAARRIMGRRWQRRSAAIPVGIDSAMLTTRAAPRRLGSQEPVRFLYIGAINRFRELELLLEAVDLVARKNDRFRVDFVGPDMSDGYYQRVIDELGIGHVAHLLPPVHYSAVSDLLTNYHVGLAYNPARPTWDFQPTIKVLEYRAIGLPIISTAVRAHEDFVEERRNGYLVRNHPKDWAAAISRLVDDRAELERLYATAQSMRRGVTHEDVAEQHERLYQQIVSGTPMPAGAAPEPDGKLISSE